MASLKTAAGDGRSSVVGHLVGDARVRPGGAGRGGPDQFSRGTDPGLCWGGAIAHFGASIYVADLVAIATVREMGCLMTGIICAGGLAPPSRRNSAR